MPIDSAGEPAPHERDTLFRADGEVRWGWSLFLFLAGSAVLMVGADVALGPVVSRMGFRAARPTAGASALLEGAHFIVVLLMTALLARLEQRPAASYGLGWPARRGAQVLQGAAWGLLLLSLLVGVLWAGGLLQLSAPQLHGAGVVRYGAAWLVVFVLTGLFEETGFRGLLQRTLTRGFAGLYARHAAPARARALAFATGAGILAVLFGAVHLGNEGEGAMGAVSAGLIGLVFSFSLWRTGSLWWAVAFHAAWDWGESFLWGVGDSGTVAVHRLLAAEPRGPAWLSGGTVGPEGSVLVLPIVALAAAVVWWTLPSQAGSPSDPACPPDAAGQAGGPDA